MTPHILHVGFEGVGHKKWRGISQLKIRPVDDVLAGGVVTITLSGIRVRPGGPAGQQMSDQFTPTERSRIPRRMLLR
jgi:hypothetical protein